MKQDNSDVKEALIEGILFVVGVFLYALCFNLFLIPNDLVVSGFSGVAIVAQKLFGWPASTFIYITNAILGDENSIITVSTYDKENEVFIGLPTIVNKRGAKGRVFVDLTEEETEKLRYSIKVVKDAVEKVK